VVREPRAVLTDFGTHLPAEQEVRVWDSSAEVRYMVLPEQPKGWESLSEAQVISKITRDSMIGVEVLAEVAE
jgi:nitrile hydratase